MALIGTISGSVGAGGSLVSATAISGTLIIADAPPSSFPAIQSGVKLFVSGNKTELGADTPNAIFGGDTFVSGAFGTDSYIQMKPVNTLRIPTNTTASYIYTSGSTNDMYFTQYAGPYTNTTRLRWLESQMHTGLLHGGIISAAVGGTTFSVAEGEGVIVSQNAFTASSPYPTIIDVKWNAVVSQSLTYVTTNQITYLGVNSSGNIFQQATPISLTDDVNYISLGRVLHQTGSVVNGAVTMPIVSYGGTQYINDFVRAIGPLKVSGHVLAASGSTLSITKTSGVSYVQGRNYTVDPNSPDVVTEVSDTPVTVSKIFYQHVSGSTIIQNTGVGAAGFTDIDPTQYNNNGTLTALSNNNKISIQRVYWYPNSVTRAFTVYYGNAEYDTLDAAQAGITTETFTEGNNTIDAAILVGYILVQKNCSSLTNASTSRIVQAGTFRGTGIGGGGGTASPTVPGGLDTYVQFNDGGSTFGGDAGLTYNKSTDTLTVAGDIAVDGGDITTAAPTFNLVNATATTVNLGGGASAVNIGAAGSAATFAGNITGSNALLSGDLAVNGGDITSTATLNISAGSGGLAFQRSGTSFATFVSGASGPFQLVTLQASSGKSLILAAGLGSTAPTPQVTVSGSYIDIRSSNSGTPSGVDFSNDVAGNPSSYLNITSGSYVPLAATISTNAAKIIAASSRDLVLGAPSGQKVFISGSTVTLNGGATGVSIQRDAAEILQVSSPGSPQVSIVPGAGYTTANLFNTTATTINFAQAANAVNIGKLTGGAVVTISSILTGSNPTFFGDSVTIGGPSQADVLTTKTTATLYNTVATTVNIGGAATTVNLGASTGRTTVNNDLAITTGNIIGAPGAGANVMTLISSGNIIAKLDNDNNGTGHQFQVQDYRGISQFTVGEDGNAEISGSLVISGSAILGSTVERLITSAGSTGTVSFDTTFGSIFYVNGPAGDILANFTNVPTANNNRVVTTTVILSQSATPRIISGIQVNSTSVSILWANKTIPTGTANQQDVFGFSLIRSGSIWTVLGQMSTYG